MAVGGGSLVGAQVKLKHRSTTTDANGAYQFDPVAAGSYKITIGTFAVSWKSVVWGNLKVKGAPSVGTKLKLKNQTTGVGRRTTTDANGNFSVHVPAAGTYKLTISPVTVP